MVSLISMLVSRLAIREPQMPSRISFARNKEPSKEKTDALTRFIEARYLHQTVLRNDQGEHELLDEGGREDEENAAGAHCMYGAVRCGAVRCGAVRCGAERS